MKMKGVVLFDFDGRLFSGTLSVFVVAKIYFSYQESNIGYINTRTLSLKFANFGINIGLYA
jgi:hypothetical protein